MSKPIADRGKEFIQNRPYTVVFAAFFLGLILASAGC